MAGMTVQQAFDLALQHRDAGRLVEAEVIYRELGEALAEQSQWRKAAEALAGALAIRPNSFETQFNLGVVLLELDQPKEAAGALHRAVKLNPELAAAHLKLGNALSRLGKFEEAAGEYRRAIDLKLDIAEVHNNLGVVLAKVGNFHEAAAAYRRAVTLQPDFAIGHSNLGNTLVSLCKLDEAVGSFQRAIGLKPDFAEGHYNLGIALEEIGEVERALAEYRRATEIKPDYIQAHSHLVFSLHYEENANGAAILAEARRWDSIHTEPARILIVPHTHNRDPGRRLRVGYVSNDFREHAVSRFLQPLFRNHDHGGFEIFGYSDVARPDRMTAVLRENVDGWREIAGLSDESVAELVRRDEIDILVDLMGHTAGSRLLVFARKPAPVQISYLGYPGTTGLKTMDYRLTDGLADPPGMTEEFYSERLLRLPRTNWCLVPSVDAPLPIDKEGAICFGSFGRLAKLTSGMMDSWAEILKATAGSRLLLKDRALADEKVGERIRQSFISRGIGPERLETVGHQSDLGEHFGAYNRVDIALDTFPYHGTTTTCDALWMGVPVVTLAGATHASRVGVSLLTNLGLAELIGKSSEEFISIAVELAGNRSKLAGLRRTLRGRMQGSPLMDGRQFARDIEAVYLETWSRWLDRSVRSADGG